MVAITNALFFIAAVTASVLPRDAATIQADLKTINTDTQTLTSKANAYSGGLNSALAIQNAEQQVESDIKAATSDANKSNAVSATDAQSIIDYINNTLEPNIKSSVNAIIAKKSNFQADGVTGTVENDFKNLQNLTTTLGNALIAKTPSGKQSAAKTSLNKVLADLQKGTDAFA